MDCFSVGDCISFEFINELTHEREWGVGCVRSVGSMMCTVCHWSPAKWNPEHSKPISEEISCLEDYITQQHDINLSDDGVMKNNSVQLEYLVNFARAERRIQALKVLEGLILANKFDDIKDIYFEPSDQVRDLCLSNILDAVYSPSGSSFTILLEEDVKRYNFPIFKQGNSKIDDITYEKVRELKFFDSRWSWSSSWPTFVTCHSVHFPWSNFEEILRCKPEEARNTFIAEVAFCCQVPMHCIIDTYFSCTDNKFSATFKVVHHPSVEASEIDVRISQHPFWSLVHLRDCSTSERKGLDRAAVYFRRMLGMDENAGSGMYFLQFLEALPQINFVTDKSAYESELMETLSLCERLNNENLSLCALLEIKENQGCRKILQTGAKDTVSGFSNNSRYKESLEVENSTRFVELRSQSEIISTLRGSEAEAKEKVVNTGTDSKENFSFFRLKMNELQGQSEKTAKENTELLEKIEELLFMLQEALTMQEEDLRCRMRAETELLRIQGLSSSPCCAESTLSAEVKS